MNRQSVRIDFDPPTSPNKMDDSDNDDSEKTPQMAFRIRPKITENPAIMRNMMNCEKFSQSTSSLSVIVLIILVSFVRVYSIHNLIDLLNQYHLLSLSIQLELFTFILFVIFYWSSVWRIKFLKFQQHLQIFLMSILYSIVLITFLLSLEMCGAFRTILLTQNSYFTLSTAMTVLIGMFKFNSFNHRSRQTTKKRGVVFIFISILFLLIIDKDSFEHYEKNHKFSSINISSSSSPPSVHEHTYGHNFYHLITSIGIADHKMGIFIGSICALLNFLHQKFQRRINRIRPVKLFHILQPFYTTLLLIIYQIIHRSYTLEVEGEKIHFNFQSILLFLFIAFMVNVINVLLKKVYFDDEDQSQSIISVLKDDNNKRVNSSTQVNEILFQKTSDMHLLTRHLPKMEKKTIKDWIVKKCQLLDTNDHSNDQTIITTNNNYMISRYMVYATYIAGIILTIHWDERYEMKHHISLGALLTCLFLMISTSNLCSMDEERSGSLVGFYQNIPLFSHFYLQNYSEHFTFYSLKSYILQILGSSDSRNIFLFLLFNLLFTFIELVYGCWANSLGLISDGFHMLFDCSALAMGLAAAIISKFPSTELFPFGFKRVELLSALVNALFLCIIALYVFLEGVGRLINPQKVEGDNLLMVSVLGLFVNLIGIFAFSHAHTHGPSSSCGDAHQHSHSNANMEGIFLHILADTLGSCGVIVSSLLIKYFNWYRSDPICSIFIAVMIFLSVRSLLWNSIEELLLKLSHRNVHQMETVLDSLLTLNDIKSYRNYSSWTTTTGEIYISIHVQVAPNTSEQEITQRCLQKFIEYVRSIRTENIWIQVEKERFFTLLIGLNASTQQIRSDDCISQAIQSRSITLNLN
ncbi:hypothetical protein SNEBB_009032 [Seison nebaliae]|nr:hypothetical protein SNEBB_009032 [Seison nebaliae]